MRESLRIIFQDAFQVKTTDPWQDVLSLLSSEQFDLIIIGIDGRVGQEIDLLRDITALNPQLPLMALIEQGQRESLEGISSSYVTDLMIKPFNVFELREGRGDRENLRALAIVDGEHYAPVVRDALAELPYEVVAAVLVGGTEKLRGGEDYGVPLVDDVDAALAAHNAEIVVDLSDEPVLGPVERFALASRVLAHGVPYVGADFRLGPPERLPFERPSVSVVGTGKRVGKTAVTGHLARLIARDQRVVVVAMGGAARRNPRS